LYDQNIKEKDLNSHKSVFFICHIFVADVLSGSASSSAHHSGVLEEWAGGQTWWNSRLSVMLATTLFVLAPLASFRHIGKDLFCKAGIWIKFFSTSLIQIKIV
jgi:hypothetical protein